MLTRCGVTCSLILVFAWSGLAAELPMHVCALLTSAEIGDAVGTPAGQAQESDIVIPEGPAKGETMRMCRWPIGAQGMVSISVVRAPQGVQREAGLAQLSRMFDTLKAQGWTEERQDFSNARCAVITPPPSAKDVPLSTGCFAEAKGMGMGIGWMGANEDTY